jgi:predicted dehydrogenase
MALDMSPEQRTVGTANFQRAVGKLAEGAAAPPPPGVTRRQFMQGLIAAGAVLPITAAVYLGYSNSSFRNRPVRAGLIGAGDEGGVLVGEHNPAYLEFVAYSDIRPFNQRRIFEGQPGTPRKGFNFHYGSNARSRIRLHTDYRDLLADETIEAVVIALPLHLHAPVAIEAMRRGKHVLCEKLMAWNIRQCKRMIAVANETEKILSVGHQRHYSMLYAHALEVIHSGILGDVRHIRALWHRNNAKPVLDNNGRPVTDPETGLTKYRDGWRPDVPPEDRAALERVITGRYDYRSMNEFVRWRLYNRTGGGLMAELGSHQLDACSIFLNKVRPIAVTAVGGKHFYRDDREVEDHVYCTFEFPGPNYRPPPQGDPRNNDIRVVTYSSISTNDFEKYGECVMGSQGTLVVETEQTAMLWGVSTREDATARSTAVTVTGAAAGRPVLDSSASTSDPRERQATDTGHAALGQGPPSRGYREEMEHFAYCIRMQGQGTDSDEERLRRQPRCGGVQAMQDAIIALTANRAMREQRRIEFQADWFRPENAAVPDADMIPRHADGSEVTV